MMDEYGIETIGIYWLNNELKDENGSVKGNCWWGVCKKTRKPAFFKIVTDTLHMSLPLVMGDVLLSEDRGCDDGKYCLNIECPYSTNNTLKESLKAQLDYLEDEIKVNDYLVKYIEDGISFITEKFIDGLSAEEFNKIFVENFNECTVNPNAFGTSIPEK